MNDNTTMFDVEPMSWEETAKRLHVQTIALHDKVERLRAAFTDLARVVEQNDHHATVRDARPIINRVRSDGRAA